MKTKVIFLLIGLLLIATPHSGQASTLLNQVLTVSTDVSGCTFDTCTEDVLVSQSIVEFSNDMGNAVDRTIFREILSPNTLDGVLFPGEAIDINFDLVTIALAKQFDGTFRFSGIGPDIRLAQAPVFNSIGGSRDFSASILYDDSDRSMFGVNIQCGGDFRDPLSCTSRGAVVQIAVVTETSAIPAIPLPATVWMLIAGLGGLFAVRRRRRAA